MDKSMVRKWFYCKYGYDVVTAQCMGFVGCDAVMRFRCGGPLRENQCVDLKRIGNETKDPHTFVGKLLNL